MTELFKQIPTMKYKPLIRDTNIQLPLSDIGGAWYMKKKSKKLLPLNEQKISKKAHEKYYKILRNLQTANWNRNDLKFQKHWNMLYQVNPRSKFLRNPYSTSLNKYYIDQDDRADHWIGRLKLKTLYYNEFLTENYY